MIEDKLIERRLLLKRAFSRSKLFKIGRKAGISFFGLFSNPWDMDIEEATLKLAQTFSDEELKEVFKQFGARQWVEFKGLYYTLKRGSLILEGSWDTVKAGIRQAKSKYGENCLKVLKEIAEANRSLSTWEITKKFKNKFDPLLLLEELEELGILEVAYEGKGYREWEIPAEILPMVRMELGMTKRVVQPTREKGKPSVISKGEALDYAQLERQEIEALDREFEEYLSNVVTRKLEKTTRFGEDFSIAKLAGHLQDMFGPLLYFDSLLSIVQQYGLSNADIVHESGKTGMKTGFSLALFGEPGTGKSFSTRDMILGNPSLRVPPHGIPGRNRYCGGITPARFIRMGEAYEGRTFNFIVPEFNDWFKYRGMVEPLKLAMEQGEIRYETHSEVIGPYRFSSFFSVNYNVATFDRGYEVTITDPNFNAIEDRMLCRLHRLTKERYVEIAKSQMKFAFGGFDMGRKAEEIRRHVTLVYAAETRHPFVSGILPKKDVLITPKAFETIGKARDIILGLIPRETVGFSTRLEKRALSFACAATLLEYFKSDGNYIPVSEEALKYAVQIYVEEAAIRSRGLFDPEEVLSKL